MRVVVAPDKFAGTLSSPEVVAAITEGWARHAPDDEVVGIPMADGGPGFIDTLHAGLGGELLAVTAAALPDWDTQYDALPAAMLRVDDTIYLESAHVVGLAVAEHSDPLRRSSHGVGVLLAHAIEAGARRIVVGVGGTATTDGGAGLLAALGASATGADLDDGPLGLKGLETVDIEAARRLVADVELVVATDVDSPLAGLFGATKTFGPQKGLREQDLPWIDGALENLAALTDRKLATQPGAGAGGGIGFALMLLGATRASGFDLVAEVCGLERALVGADLVITGEGAFDFSSRAGKVPHAVAEIAQRALVPCILLAGRVDIGARETRAAGIESAYSMSEAYGEQAALSDPQTTLRDLATRVARTWSH